MDEILFFKFPGVIAAMVEYQTTDRHVMNSVSSLVEATRDWFTYTVKSIFHE